MRCGDIDVSTTLHQLLCHFHQSFLGTHVEGSPLKVVDSIHIGSYQQQQLHKLWMSIARGIVKWRLMVMIVYHRRRVKLESINIGALVKQKVDDLLFSFLNG